MKKLFISALVAAALSSCSKKDDVQPKNQITYAVGCNYCQVTFVDNVNQVQSLVVRGNWQYSFDAGTLDQAKVTTYVPAPLLPLPVGTTIYYNDVEVASNITSSIGQLVTTTYQIK